MAVVFISSVKSLISEMIGQSWEFTEAAVGNLEVAGDNDSDDDVDDFVVVAKAACAEGRADDADDVDDDVDDEVAVVEVVCLMSSWTR